MKLVRQQNARDCGIAALMMLTGHERMQVCGYFGRTNFGNRGLYLRGLEDYLVDAGYAIAPKARYMGWFAHEDGGHVERRPWPPEPFADKHLCTVEVVEGAPCTHYVVMLRDGTVLDPLSDEPRRLADYRTILSVIGISSQSADSGAAVREAVAHEREVCARLVEGFGESALAFNLAALIRSRK